MGQRAACLDYPQKREAMKTITRLRGKPWTCPLCSMDGRSRAPRSGAQSSARHPEGNPGWTEATADIPLSPIPGILSLAIGHGDRHSRWRLLAVQYRLDLDHLQDSQIGSLSLKEKNRIVIGGILWNQDESLRCGTTFGTSRKR